MWNLINAIGRKIQSFLPQAPAVSKPLDLSSYSNLTVPKTTAPTGNLSLGQEQSNIQKAAAQDPQLKQQINNTVNAPANTSTMNESQKNDWARSQGYTGWNDFNDQRNRQNQPQQQQVSVPAPQATAPTPIFNPDVYKRNIEQMATKAGNFGKSVASGVTTGASNAMGAVSRALGVQPVYSAEYGQKEPKPAQNGLGKFLGGALERIGTNLGAPELKWSEGLAGGATPLTGQTEQSAKVFSPFRYTPESRIGATDTKTGLGYTPGSAPNLVGTQTLSSTPPDLSGGGSGEQTQAFSSISNQEVRDFILQELTTTSEQIAQMPTDDLVAFTKQMSDQMGITTQQAAVNLANQEIMKLGDLIDNLDKDITAQSEGSLMTESQRRRLVASKGAPLRAQLIQLMRTAQYAGIGLDNSMKMLSQYIDSKKTSMNQQFQNAQLTQQADEKRKDRLMSLLPYVQPKAQVLKSSTKSGASGGGTDFKSALAGL